MFFLPKQAEMQKDGDAVSAIFFPAVQFFGVCTILRIFAQFFRVIANICISLNFFAHFLNAFLVQIFSNSKLCHVISLKTFCHPENQSNMPRIVFQ